MHLCDVLTRRSMPYVCVCVCVTGQRFAMNEEKVLLAAIFRKFHVTSMQSREELRPIAEIITRPSDGILVQLSPR